ncbi:MAG: transcriptional regulator [Lewinellaceae bacterium]|nr:transcriptional regulator [Lewinellaceae bacterium]
MNIKPIKSEQDYECVLARLDAIFDAPADTPEGDEAEILTLLVEHYENEHHFIDAPDPIEAIKIRLQEMNLRQSDLVGIIGGKSRVSEVLNRKRKLSVEMIRQLSAKLKLPTALLVQDYALAG